MLKKTLNQIYASFGFPLVKRNRAHIPWGRTNKTEQSRLSAHLCTLEHGLHSHCYAVHSGRHIQNRELARLVRCCSHAWHKGSQPLGRDYLLFTARRSIQELEFPKPEILVVEYLNRSPARFEPNRARPLLKPGRARRHIYQNHPSYHQPSAFPNAQCERVLSTI